MASDEAASTGNDCSKHRHLTFQPVVETLVPVPVCVALVEKRRWAMTLRKRPRSVLMVAPRSGGRALLLICRDWVQSTKCSDRPVVGLVKLRSRRLPESLGARASTRARRSDSNFVKIISLFQFCRAN